MSYDPARSTGQVFASREILLAVERDMAGEQDAAAAGYERAMHAMQVVALGAWSAIAYNNLGCIVLGRGDKERAWRYIKRAWQLHRGAGARLSELVAVCNLTEIARMTDHRGRYERYRRYAIHARIKLVDTELIPQGGFVPGNLCRLLSTEVWNHAQDVSTMLTPPPNPLDSGLGPALVLPDEPGDPFDTGSYRAPTLEEIRKGLVDEKE